MPGELHIRHAEAADYQNLIERVDDWWGGRTMRAMLPRLFFAHFQPTSFVAERGGVVVGFLCGFVSQTAPEITYVHFVGVDPAVRGAGIGQALYVRFGDAARTLGCREVHAVTAPTNAASIAFHRRLGFEALPGDAATAEGVPYTEGYDGPGEDRVRFRLGLFAQTSA
ncbi:MAG: GNAT family N-acetyltransferase [Chloroflexia bacterium]|nr:GNAT family N-acetyltransferase [Chloroflexia bacterium]